MPKKSKTKGIQAVITPAHPGRDPKEQELINQTLDKARLKKYWKELGVTKVLGVNC